MRELARHSVWFLFFESDCYKHKLALVVKAQLKYELCWWFGFTSWLLLYTGEVDEFREGTYTAKKILLAWSHLFNDEDAVKYASGSWPGASTNRRYYVR